MSVLWIVLILVALQRVLELVYSARNTKRLRELGGIEFGAVQYPFFVLLHAAWLACMAIFIPASTIPNWWLIGVYAILQPLRIWTIATLGPYWTTRIITLPGAPLVRIVKAFRRSSPPRSISDNASANEAACTPATKLLTSFIRVPLPMGPR